MSDIGLAEAQKKPGDTGEWDAVHVPDVKLGVKSCTLTLNPEP